MTSHLGKNFVIVLTLVAAGFFWAWLVFRPYLGDESKYTDGVRTYDVSAAGGEVRYAVWDMPTALTETINTNEDERRPALSPDGAVMVFVVGVPGLGTDFYIADLVEGQPVDPRPLSNLNSGYDDLAPGFAEDALFFTSDRPGGQGGLDIWRASYENGMFGRPEPLGAGFNTEFDETDPAPAPDGTLLFASNRSRGIQTDFDLYSADQLGLALDDPARQDGAESRWRVEPLRSLNTRFEEREPALNVGGDTLFFASDRIGAVGGYDIYRSARSGGGWLSAEPLLGINTVRSERDPLPSREGFELLFSSETEINGTDLFRARSKELYRSPGRPVGWRELLFLGMLLFVALLAGLAKKWDHLEVVYKCFLVSAVVHGLLMLWLQGVEPNLSTPVEEDDRIRLRIVPAPQPVLASLSRSDERMQFVRPESTLVEAPERREVDFAPVAGADLVPEEVSLEPILPEFFGPAPVELQTPDPVAHEEIEVPVEAATDAFTRLQAEAIEMVATVDEQTIESLAHPELPVTGNPERVERDSPLLSQHDPETPEVDRRVEVELPEAPSRFTFDAARALAPAATTVAVESAVEAVERRAADAPEFALTKPTASGMTATPRTANADRINVRTQDALARVEIAAEETTLDVPRVELPEPSSTRLVAEVERTQEPSTLELEPEVRRVDETFALMNAAAPEPIRVAGPNSAVLARPATTVTVDSPERKREGNVALESDARPARSISLAPPAVSSDDLDVFRRPSAARMEATDRPSDLAVGLADATETVERYDERPDAPAFTETDETRLARAAAPSREDEQAYAGRRAGELSSDAIGPERFEGDLTVRPELDAMPAAPTPLDVDPARRRSPSVAVELGAETVARMSAEPVAEASWSEGIDGELSSSLESRIPRTKPHGAVPEAEITRGAWTGTRPEPELGSAVRPGADLSSRGADEGNAPAHAPVALDRGSLAEHDMAGGLDLQDRPAARESLEPEPAATQQTDVTSDLIAAADIDRPRVNDEGPGRFRRDDRPRALETDPGFRPLRPESDRRRDEPSAPRPVPTESVGADDNSPFQWRTGAQKTRALELHGGSAETELAVASGLGYLARIQAKRGYWGSPQDEQKKYGHVVVGKTGLALLAFLGAGQTQQSDTQFSPQVVAAIDFLLGVQDPETGHFGYSSSYSHGIATYALAECYALTGDRELRRPIERAVAQILRHQDGSFDPELHGGWGYYYPDEHQYDRWSRSSITGWQVMALKSARLAGITVPERAFRDAKEFLKNTWDKEHAAFRYSHDPKRLDSGYPILPGSHAAALFALSILGEDLSTPEYAGALKFVAERAPSDYEYTNDDDFVFHAKGNTYFWYYGTLALFRTGGSPWERWNVAMKTSLIPAQQEDGSWIPNSVYADYAGDTSQNRAYTTALCVLSLEVYYRYFTPLLTSQPPK